MTDYPYLDEIELSRLRLDVRNPRLPNVPDSQRDAFAEMSQIQGSKLLKLCRHIAKHGLSPVQRFVVIPDDENQFIVLDANRRLTALRALENPELVQEALTEAENKQLKDLALDFDPPEDASCVVFETRDDADVWLELLHEGESEGAGLVTWGAQQKSRHLARKGSKPPHLQVLDFVLNLGQVGDKTKERFGRGAYPVSTLERALSTPHVRDRLGITLTNGIIETDFPKSEVLKGLNKLVDEIGRGQVKVADFMTVTDREKYIDAFKKNELPSPGARLASRTPLGDAPDQPVTGTRGKKPRDKKPSTARNRLVPPEFSATIDVARINDVYNELKEKLKVNDVPNAVGVLFRVFLELSVDEFIENNNLTIKGRATLATKVTTAANYMEKQGHLDAKDAIHVKEAVKSEDKVNIATNLNALVHSRSMSVAGNDLKALWIRLEKFVAALWA